jgi:hypothetical protein
MKPELMYVKGSSDPMFMSLSLEGFEKAEDITGDYVFAFSKATHFCIGSSHVQTDNFAAFAIHGDDFTTEVIENVQHGETFGFGYYDAQDDNFYELEAQFLGINNQPIQNGNKWYVMALVKAYALSLKTDENGNYIKVPLQVNTEITKVVLDTIVNETWETGDDAAIPIKVIGQNVENINIEVKEGKGQITHYEKANWINGTWTNWVYNVHPEDTTVRLITTANDIFTNSQVFDEDTIAVSHQTYADVLFENEFIVLFKDGNAVKAAAKTNKVLVHVHKYETPNNLSINPKMKRGWFLTTIPRIVGSDVDFRSNGGKWKIYNLQVMIDRRYVKQHELETDFVVNNASDFDLPEPELQSEPLPAGHEDLPENVFINDGKLVVGLTGENEFILSNRTSLTIVVSWKDPNAKSPRTKGVRLLPERNLNINFSEQMKYITDRIEFLYWYRNERNQLVKETKTVKKPEFNVNQPGETAKTQMNTEAPAAKTLSKSSKIYVETDDFIFEELPCGEKFKVTSKHIIEARNPSHGEFFKLELRPTWNPNPLAGLDISVIPGTNGEPSTGREYQMQMLNFNRLRDLAQTHNKQWRWSLSWNGKTEYFTIT